LPNSVRVVPVILISAILITPVFLQFVISLGLLRLLHKVPAGVKSLPSITEFFTLAGNYKAILA
jgi:hypothetical protein